MSSESVTYILFFLFTTSFYSFTEFYISKCESFTGFLKMFKTDRYETQVSEGGEVDLHKYLADCEKNPGHSKFIPVRMFSMHHLPEEYCDPDLFELIKSAADLTVRVEVKITSPQRPEFYPGTYVTYPFYNLKNKTIMRLGTGEIGVRKFIDGRGVIEDGKKYFSHLNKLTRTCPCTKCQHSDKPNNVWWEIYVYTAAHVVFDDSEASRTSCRLFYDEQDSRVVNLNDLSINNVNIAKDWCVLKYLTCDSLGDKLYNMAVHRSDLWWKVYNKYKNTSNAKLTFIVSHPHGCCKLISVGHLVDIYKISKYNNTYDCTKLTYTTCTCPGSSGASVYCVGCDNGHYHSGALDDEVNLSCEGLLMK